MHTTTTATTTTTTNIIIIIIITITTIAITYYYYYYYKILTFGGIRNWSREKSLKLKSYCEYSICRSSYGRVWCPLYSFMPFSTCTFVMIPW